MPKIKNNQAGFTIIEVMIVLAIAGLILATVFVAVPALQRNQRNSARALDVSYLKAQFTQAASNNNGRQPTLAQFKAIVKADELNWLGLTDAGVLDSEVPATTSDIDAVASKRLLWITAITNADLTTKKITNLTAENDGFVAMYVGWDCKNNTVTLSSNGAVHGDIVEAGTRHSVAFVYRPEGSDTAICSN